MRISDVSLSLGGVGNSGEVADFWADNGTVFLSSNCCSNDNKVCVTGQNLKSPHKSLKKGVAANFISPVICFTILLGMPNDQRTTVPFFKGMKVFLFLVNVPCIFLNEKTFLAQNY